MIAFFFSITENSISDTTYKVGWRTQGRFHCWSSSCVVCSHPGNASEVTHSCRFISKKIQVARPIQQVYATEVFKFKKKKIGAMEITWYPLWIKSFSEIKSIGRSGQISILGAIESLVSSQLSRVCSGCDWKVLAGHSASFCSSSRLHSFICSSRLVQTVCPHLQRHSTTPPPWAGHTPPAWVKQLTCQCHGVWGHKFSSGWDLSYSGHLNAKRNWIFAHLIEILVWGRFALFCFCCCSVVLTPYPILVNPGKYVLNSWRPCVWSRSITPSQHVS